MAGFAGAWEWSIKKPGVYTAVDHRHHYSLTAVDHRHHYSLTSLYMYTNLLEGLGQCLWLVAC